MEQPDGHLHLILGGSGGSRIFGSIVQVILNMDWGMDVSAAIEWPRVHNQLFPHAVDIESEIDPKEIGGLREKGHLAVGEWRILQLLFLCRELTVWCISSVGYQPRRVRGSSGAPGSQRDTVW